MDKLSFYYSKKRVLRDVSCRFQGNKVNAIVGLSGCGKSTLLDIIMGIYEDYSGQIKIGDISYENISKDEIFKKVVLVNQEEFLISGSIKDNLVLGKKKIDQSKIEEICKLVNIHDFIEKLPNKYDTIMGEDGIKVSVGQKQRLAIARALVKEPDIFLFDEITSALDSESEQIIINVMKKLSKTATVIIVSHKEKTILSANNILLMHDGIIEEVENYKMLKTNNALKDLLELSS